MHIVVQQDVVVSYLLVMTRLLTVLTVAPPFGGSSLPLQVRIAIAAAVGLAVAPVAATELPASTSALVVAIVYQVVVGALFGYLIQLLLAAPLVAGTLIDFMTGFSAGGLFDPFSDSSTTPAGRLNQMVAIIILVALDGHLMIVRGAIRSYEAAPLTGLRIDSLESVLAEGVGQLVLAAIEIALPVLVALLLTEVVLGLAARAAPRLNVMVVGFAVKGIVFLLVFAVTLPLVINAVAALLDRALRWGLAIVGA
ncbi:MAG: flagellar biosynthetic protein FliR [Acidimicrobiales bacterium]